MSPHVVAIGASAGGLEGLTAIIRRLPPSLDAAVLVAVHMPANGSAALPRILAREGDLPVSFATDGQPLAAGHVYVAPPDFHLLVDGQQLRVVHGPRENGFRPAIDPLFRSAARSSGPRVIGVILSGALSDGTYGLSVIKQHGGTAIVQDPDEAAVPSMPRNAIAAVDVDHVLQARDIAGVITELTRAQSAPEVNMPRSRDLEPQLAAKETEVAEMQQRFGAASGLTCPDCGGALWEVQENRVLRYQCHVGHQYAPDNLDAAQRDAIDSALWSAVRILEEHAELKLRMARRATDNRLAVVADGFESDARDAHRQAQSIRSVLVDAGAALNSVPGESPRRAAATNGGTARRRTPRKRTASGRRTS
jgi:two-component system, chemotaxis family, protein-glutamate methylesterase/glutaminase